MLGGKKLRKDKGEGVKTFNKGILGGISVRGEHGQEGYQSVLQNYVEEGWEGGGWRKGRKQYRDLNRGKADEHVQLRPQEGVIELCPSYHSGPEGFAGWETRSPGWQGGAGKGGHEEERRSNGTERGRCSFEEGLAGEKKKKK